MQQTKSIKINNDNVVNMLVASITLKKQTFLYSSM